MDMSDDDHSVSSLPFKKSRWEHEHKDHAGDPERSGADGAESTMVSQDGELKMKILHIEVLQETIRNLQTQLLENKAKETERQNRISELEDELKDANVKQLLLKTKIATSKVAASSTASISSSKGDSEGESDYACASAVPETGPPTATVCKATSTRDVGSGESFPPPVATELEAPNEKEIKMVAFAATFMMIHPLGVRLDQVWAYVERYVAELKPKELEDTFARYPQLFKRCALAPGMGSGDGSASGESVEQIQDRISSSPWYRFIGHESSNVRD
ncbi:AGAP011541-PA-like protein [Anopheles sinensis]|uniref:AGAP011541-PA-like protein n=1 Tax=Anopheles sinensis TaxID=74873 RepID=A0A084VRK8_ANOSI|nr:AGAP011541-PA-like protein [Anopheles sinensis]